MISTRLKIFLIVFIVTICQVKWSMVSAFGAREIDDALHGGLVDSIIISKIYDAIRDINQTAETIRSLKSISMYSYMDTNVDPCEDFYQYACGNFDKLHHIADDKSEFNIFTILTEKTLYSLKELLSNDIYSKYSATPTPQEQAKLFYDSCVDEYAVNARGPEPLKELINNFGGFVLSDSNWNPADFDWINMTTSIFNKLNTYSLLVYRVDPSLEDGSKFIENIEEPPLSLKNRDVFLDLSDISRLTAYQALIEKVLKLLHVPPEEAEKIAVEIVEFERDFAKITKDQVTAGLFDYIEITIEELIQKYPKIDWIRFLTLIRNEPVDINEKILIDESEYYNDLPDLIEKTDKRIVINYILWRIVNDFYVYLDSNFLNAKQDLDQILLGQLIIKPRWETCIDFAKQHLSIALSEMYIRNYFDESTRTDLIILTEDIKETFREFLHSKDWVDDVTKNKAEEKLNNLTIGIGYPDYIIDQDTINKEYARLEIDQYNYFKNILNICKHERNRHTEDFRKKIRDRTKWMGSPIEVNAYQEVTSNALIFTAALLQIPVVHHHFPKFVNYGALGTIMGHEITHGFDSLGRRFDWEGNLKNWWTNESAEEFSNRELCFVEQYSNYSINGKFAKGENSRLENVADNGGLRESYYSYKKWLQNNEGSDILLDENLPGFNMTNTKMFFLSYAQLWCEAIRPEKVIEVLDTDSHCPGEVRVRGVLSNSKEFSEEFNCPTNSRMNPPKKCLLW